MFLVVFMVRKGKKKKQFKSQPPGYYFQFFPPSSPIINSAWLRSRGRLTINNVGIIVTIIFM